MARRPRNFLLLFAVVFSAFCTLSSYGSSLYLTSGVVQSVCTLWLNSTAFETSRNLGTREDPFINFDSLKGGLDSIDPVNCSVTIYIAPGLYVNPNIASAASISLIKDVPNGVHGSQSDQKVLITVDPNAFILSSFRTGSINVIQGVDVSGSSNGALRTTPLISIGSGSLSMDQVSLANFQSFVPLVVARGLTNVMVTHFIGSRNSMTISSTKSLPVPPIPRVNYFGGGTVFFIDATSSLTIADSSFEHNYLAEAPLPAEHATVSGKGGAVILTQQTLNLTRCIFESNSVYLNSTAFVGGGGIFFQKLAIDNSEFSQSNSNIPDVGAHANDDQPPFTTQSRISHSRFFNNSATNVNELGLSYGGAVLLPLAGQFAIRNSEFVANQADSGGGVSQSYLDEFASIDSRVFSLSISNVNFTRNICTWRGCGLSLSPNALTLVEVTESRFDSNLLDFPLYSQSPITKLCRDIAMETPGAKRHTAGGAGFAIRSSHVPFTTPFVVRVLISNTIWTNNSLTAWNDCMIGGGAAFIAERVEALTFSNSSVYSHANSAGGSIIWIRQFNNITIDHVDAYDNEIQRWRPNSKSYSQHGSVFDIEMDQYMSTSSIESIPGEADTVPPSSSAPAHPNPTEPHGNFAVIINKLRLANNTVDKAVVSISDVDSVFMQGNRLYADSTFKFPFESSEQEASTSSSIDFSNSPYIEQVTHDAKQFIQKAQDSKHGRHKVPKASRRLPSYPSSLRPRSWLNSLAINQKALKTVRSRYSVHSKRLFSRPKLQNNNRLSVSNPVVFRIAEVTQQVVIYDFIGYNASYPYLAMGDIPSVLMRNSAFIAYDDDTDVGYDPNVPSMEASTSSISINSVPHIYVSGCFFLGNKATAISLEFSTLILNNSSFIGNRDDIYSGALELTDSHAFVDNSQFIANSGVLGGAIVTNDNLILRRTVLEHNWGANGGAIHQIDALTRMDNCQCNHNIASYIGGCYAGVFRTVLNATRSHFKSNRAEAGGAIAIEAASILYAEDIVAHGNIAKGVGSTSGAGGKGGAIYLDEYTTMFLSRCSFSNNSATDTSIGFVGNVQNEKPRTKTAQLVGLPVPNPSLSFSKPTDVKPSPTNTSPPLSGLGGAIYINDPRQITIFQTDITWNTAKNRGGGIYVQIAPTVLASKFSLLNCSFAQNQAGLAGGAVSILTNQSAADLRPPAVNVPQDMLNIPKSRRSLESKDGTFFEQHDLDMLPCDHISAGRLIEMETASLLQNSLENDTNGRNFAFSQLNFSSNCASYGGGLEWSPVLALDKSNQNTVPISSPLTMTKSYFSSNFAIINGGAIYTAGPPQSYLKTTTTMFYKNFAIISGAAFFYNYFPPSIAPNLMEMETYNMKIPWVLMKDTSTLKDDAIPALRRFVKRNELNPNRLLSSFVDRMPDITTPWKNNSIPSLIKQFKLSFSNDHVRTVSTLDDSIFSPDFCNFSDGCFVESRTDIEPLWGPLWASSGFRFKILSVDAGQTQKVGQATALTTPSDAQLDTQKVFNPGEILLTYMFEDLYNQRPTEIILYSETKATNILCIPPPPPPVDSSPDSPPDAAPFIIDIPILNPESTDNKCSSKFWMSDVPYWIDPLNQGSHGMPNNPFPNGNRTLQIVAAVNSTLFRPTLPYSAGVPNPFTESVSVTLNISLFPFADPVNSFTSLSSVIQFKMIGCPVGYGLQPFQADPKWYICNPCPINTYNMNGDGQCYSCQVPNFASMLSCELSKVTAHAGYFAHANNKTNALFVSICKAGYCLTDSCESGRKGVLCGDCKPGYSETLVFNNCTNDHCLTPTWLILIVAGLLWMASPFVLHHLVFYYPAASLQMIFVYQMAALLLNDSLTWALPLALPKVSFYLCGFRIDPITRSVVWISIHFLPIASIVVAFVIHRLLASCLAGSIPRFFETALKLGHFFDYRRLLLTLCTISFVNIAPVFKFILDWGLCIETPVGKRWALNPSVYCTSGSFIHTRITAFLILVPLLIFICASCLTFLILYWKKWRKESELDRLRGGSSPLHLLELEIAALKDGVVHTKEWTWFIVFRFLLRRQSNYTVLWSGVEMIVRIMVPLLISLSALEELIRPTLLPIIFLSLCPIALMLAPFTTRLQRFVSAATFACLCELSIIQSDLFDYPSLSLYTLLIMFVIFGVLTATMVYAEPKLMDLELRAAKHKTQLAAADASINKSTYESERPVVADFYDEFDDDAKTTGH